MRAAKTRIKAALLRSKSRVAAPPLAPIQAVCSLCGAATTKRLSWRAHNMVEETHLVAICHNGRWFGVWVPVSYLPVMASQGLLTEAAERARVLWGLK